MIEKSKQEYTICVEFAINVTKETYTKAESDAMICNLVDELHENVYGLSLIGLHIEDVGRTPANVSAYDNTGNLVREWFF